MKKIFVTSDILSILKLTHTFCLLFYLKYSVISLRFQPNNEIRIHLWDVVLSAYDLDARSVLRAMSGYNFFLPVCII